jgi:hypothetical protein
VKFEATAVNHKLKRTIIGRWSDVQGFETKDFLNILRQPITGLVVLLPAPGPELLPSSDESLAHLDIKIAVASSNVYGIAKGADVKRIREYAEGLEEMCEIRDWR